MRNENIDHPQFLRTKHFSKTAKFLGIPDQVFLTAIDELQCNDHHVEIGHGVYQKTINNGSHVAILLHNSGEYWIFSYLFSTAERSTLTTNELNAFVELAKAYRLMTEDQFLSLLDRKTADLMLIGGRFKRGAFVVK